MKTFNFLRQERIKNIAQDQSQKKLLRKVIELVRVINNERVVLTN